MVTEVDPDLMLRMRVIARIQQLAANGSLSSQDLRAGVEIEGVRISIGNPQRGIFKPKQLEHLLSIRTVYPARRPDVQAELVAARIRKSGPRRTYRYPLHDSANHVGRSIS